MQYDRLMHVTRRRFLKQTFAATAACGLAQHSFASNTRPQSITDTHVYLGHWPHQQLPSDDPAKLVADLRRNGVTKAWVGSFDGLFHKDVAGVNQRLAEACSRVGDGMLIPFSTINPTLPDWEDDIRRCQASFHMPGIRLHPNYHGYTLDDPRFARLLELATSRGLVVQLVAGKETERRRLLNVRIPQVDIRPLGAKTAAFQKLRLVVANANCATDDGAMLELLPLKSVYFDFGRAENANDVRLLVEKASPDRVVFGSGTPLQNIEPGLTKFHKAQLTNDNQQAIATKNANRLIMANRNY
jgi:uncharacterized protein